MRAAVVQLPEFLAEVSHGVPEHGDRARGPDRVLVILHLSPQDVDACHGGFGRGQEDPVVDADSSEIPDPMTQRGQSFEVNIADGKDGIPSDGLEIAHVHRHVIVLRLDDVLDEF